MGKSRKEEVSSQSAAQFFSEHQQIAGFDNAGKSLFTTIRELVENSLDACESIGRLPVIKVTIHEYTETEHNKLHGIKTHLSPKKVVPATTASIDDDMSVDNDLGFGESQMSPQTSEIKGPKPQSVAALRKAAAAAISDAKKADNTMYYRICCTDNGCGIPEESIGDSLGRVLSGSKHGVRQTRGKFGLGAKMALIWSKKSSGLPIEVYTAHVGSLNGAASHKIRMILDIDIYKNLPKILKQERKKNESNWSGTELTLTIGGNFGAYRTKILQYFQQLAVITPYAEIEVDFTSARQAKNSFQCTFSRRSDQMPPLATEINPHPHSLNNITLNGLLKNTNTPKVAQFLSRELSGVSTNVATNIVQQTRLENKSPQSLSAAQVAALKQRLRDEKGIREPSALCLSPAGEYNLRLGILKELEPAMVATYTEKAGSHEGHPFIVEAAVSLGGKGIREGINIYRFANRIPLLFEVGADVVTRVAQKLSWAQYHINQNTDRIGVFVSIVATRIPFKGTSKEYVGEDVNEIKAAVKKCISMCCLSLKANLAQKLARQTEQERKKLLVKYIPDISRSLYVVLQKIQAKEESGEHMDLGKDKAAHYTQAQSLKRTKTMASVSDGSLDEKTLFSGLQKAVDKFEADSALASMQMESANATKEDRVKLFLQPCGYGVLPGIEHYAWSSVLGTDGHVKLLVNYDYSKAAPAAAKSAATAAVAAASPKATGVKATTPVAAAKSASFSSSSARELKRENGLPPVPAAARKSAAVKSQPVSIDLTGVEMATAASTTHRSNVDAETVVNLATDDDDDNNDNDNDDDNDDDDDDDDDREDEEEEWQGDDKSAGKAATAVTVDVIRNRRQNQDQSQSSSSTAPAAPLEVEVPEGGSFMSRKRRRSVAQVNYGDQDEEGDEEVVTDEEEEEFD